VSALDIPGPTTAQERLAWSGLGDAPALPVNVSSNGRSNFIVVKSGPGTIYGASIYSNKASAQFILLFDAATLPAEGTIPAAVFTVAATGNLGLYWGSVGRSFSQGLVLCNSSTDNSKTIALADCWFDAQFI